MIVLLGMFGCCPGMYDSDNSYNSDDDDDDDDDVNNDNDWTFKRHLFDNFWPPSS